MLYQPLESTGLRVAGKQNNSIYKIKARAEERGKVSFGVTTTSLIPQELNPKKKKGRKTGKKTNKTASSKEGRLLNSILKTSTSPGLTLALM